MPIVYHVTPTEKFLLWWANKLRVCSNDYSYVIWNLYRITMHRGKKRLEVFPKENFHHHLMKNQSRRCCGKFIVYKNFYMASIILYPVTWLLPEQRNSKKTGNLITPWKESTVHYQCHVSCIKAVELTRNYTLGILTRDIYMHAIFSYLNVTNWLYNSLYHWLYYTKPFCSIIFHSIPFHSTFHVLQYTLTAKCGSLFQMGTTLGRSCIYKHQF